jgi:hypothetical protein
MRTDDSASSDPENVLGRPQREDRRNRTTTAAFLAEVDDAAGLYESPDRLVAAGIAPVLKGSGIISYRRKSERDQQGTDNVFHIYCASAR